MIAFNCRNIAASMLLVFLLTQLVTGAQENLNAYSSDKNVIAKGQTLFQLKCASCHNFKQQAIGPDLSGITAQVSAAWLRSFIRNPQQKARAGDKRAVALFAKYKVPMPPNPDLTDDEFSSLLSFINTHKKTASENNSSSKSLPGYGLPVKDPVPAKIIHSGLTLELQQVAIAPLTAEKAPVARINQMVVLPGEKERVFIQELRGKLYELRNDALRTVFDITELRPSFIHSPGHATGFGSIAFHPDFLKNGLMYTTHTEKKSSASADFFFHDSISVAMQWVLTEWKINEPGSDSFSGRGRELWRINMPSQIHGVQQITFNPLAGPGSPDYGLLYIGIGDGGSAEAGYSGLCNSRNTIWSSILRIDPLGRNSANGRYGIPPGNPYAGATDSDIKKEVFARGFRNPNRITWSPDGKMLVTDIGLNNIEELNIVQAGGDYGWPVREGTFLMNNKGKMNVVYPLPANESKFVYPVVQYDHDEGNAISGGFVYEGEITGLQNKYIFGDIVRGRVFYVESNHLQIGKRLVIKEFALRFNGAPGRFETITGNAKADLRFGIGANRQLYLFTKSDGRIWIVKSCLPD